ncbi:FctA domain-containing protein [Clostridium boliviensis]|uniref:FctA domain-containing protein n=1 Tax=Clostridium boliviensis TaxID=318465 RepID=A0ABU4GI75_9CLOT|nr:FctA domain-containing protein [Clostridium boliviensis]MDW2796663.1 FctA domain-containing protein [Clostridium boliviensis]
MFKIIRKGLPVMLLALFGLFLYPGKVLAASVQPLTIYVTTVIDNSSDYPDQAGKVYSRYDAKRIYQMSKSGSYPAYYPSGYETGVVTVKNGLTSTVKFSGKSSGTNCNTVWFGANGYTDSHLSLVSVEYGENVSAYTYNGTGKASDPFATQAYNWISIGGNAQSVNVTLHFRYNPDIDEVPPKEVPEPDHKKVIDYLGDGAGNPDTDAHGVNDYRIYLDLTTSREEEAKKSDIIFVLDVSNSMEESMGGASRFEVMKQTVYNAVSTLSENPDNRFSIITFGTNSNLVVSGSTDKNSLLHTINSLALPGGAEGGTNYYQSMNQASELIGGISSPGAEQVVFFITDGQPTAATPAAQALGYSVYTEVGTIYAADAARQMQGVDRFYSIFMGSSTGGASTLQTITQMVNTSIEKYMVQAASAEQINNAFNRFLSQISNSFYDVTISDQLSEYVEYMGDLKVMRQTGSAQPEYLSDGSDYFAGYENAGINVKLLSGTLPASRYVVSFNVRASDKALDSYDTNQSYPHTGDSDTDYKGNSTSSGMPGFYSNAKAGLTYSYGNSGRAEYTYNKPVIQVVEPEPVQAEIQLKKILTGMTLEAGSFQFEISKITDGNEIPVATAFNDGEGNITFPAVELNKPGVFLYHVKEIIPKEKIPGMVYDTKTIQVEAEAARSGDELKAQVRYPADVSFVNHYEPQPVSVSLNAQKKLSGRALKNGMFQFRLLTGNNEGVETVSNNGSGKISFSTLTFTKEGTYTYLIRESVPIPADPNITYDLKTITAKVLVTDSGGKLKAEVSYWPDQVFKNSFTYQTESAAIEVKKVLTGMQLTAGLFEFELKDMETGDVQKSVNKADGTVSFLKSYDEPGEHTYQIREIEPSDPIPYMNYDGKTITVTVRAEDDGSGNLVTTVEYPADITFYNTYKIRGGIW